MKGQIYPSSVIAVLFDVYTIIAFMNILILILVKF